MRKLELEKTLVLISRSKLTVRKSRELAQQIRELMVQNQGLCSAMLNAKKPNRKNLPLAVLPDPKWERNPDRAEEVWKVLRHASRLAAVGELTAMIAHELNQPLGAMLLNLDRVKALLDDDTSPVDEAREILAEVRADNVRASETIRRIRALVSRHEMELHPVDINAAVLEVVKLAKADISRRGVQLHVECRAPFPTVQGDSVHLQQVVLNLITNGLDAMNDNAPFDRQLFVSTSAGVDGYVEIKVKDTGHGIESENLLRIFESFFTTKPGGTGMGLSLAHSIVQMHSGRLWAENNHDGNGATFRFILPIVMKEVQPPIKTERLVGTAAVKV